MNLLQLISLVTSGLTSVIVSNERSLSQRAREKLSKIQQHHQGSCDDEEEAMVELITEEEHAIIPDDEIMCEDMWCCDYYSGY